MLRKPVTLGVAEAGELRLPGEFLDQLGLAAGARGVVQVSPERLLLLPVVNARDAQAEIAAFVEEMEAGSVTLQRLIGRLPRTGEATEAEPLSDREAEMRTALECILHDELRPAIQKLRRAAEAAERP